MSNSRRTRVVSVFRPGLLAALLLLLLSCQESSRVPAGAAGGSGEATDNAGMAATPSPRLPERTRVTVGSTPGAAFPVYIALERGYFQEVNIDLDSQDIANATQVTALLTTGEIDVGATALAAGLFNAFGRGLPVRVILDMSHLAPEGRSHPILARQELYAAGELRAVDQLKGRRIALASVPGGLGIALDRALQRTGLSVDDVDQVQLPFAEHPLALANGSIDAAVSFYPLAARVIERNAGTPIAYLNEASPDYQAAFTMIGPRLIERPEVARAFAVAYVRGGRDYERARRFGENLEAVAAAIGKYNRQEPSAVAALLKEGQMTATDPDGRVKLDSMQYDLQWYLARGIVTSDVRLADFVDMQYASYASGVLGPFR